MSGLFILLVPILIFLALCFTLSIGISFLSILLETLYFCIKHWHIGLLVSVLLLTFIYIDSWLLSVICILATLFFIGKFGPNYNSLR
ncbi:Uncharacterised protein [Canicola haemoglobinophilus]|uniref:Uncharacterized protein n=1 Tax=Canicola haemoglobinophilus TaxID=733 RepID=A0A377HW71_9PAST|nr:Uncharacterised protein [Canicola haemoglobinophilus]STO60169.1 Uncharacterised protein [Canicola haemoglobinophilus]STO68897.1 Uncharacterised protein [Canicola haemoglobinophilus]